MAVIKSLACLVIMLSSQFLIPESATAQSSAYDFAYIAIQVNSQTDQSRLVTIDPIHNTYSTGLAQLFPTGSFLTTYATWISPSGEWGIFSYEISQQNYGNRLINFRTGFTQELPKDITTFALGDYSRPAQTLAWSPDNRFFAFSVSKSDICCDFEADLFSISTMTITKLNTNQQEAFRFDWTTDSSTVLVEGGNNNPTTLNIINVKANTLTKSIDLTDKVGDNEEEICNLQWSPDNRYIAFQNYCGTTVYGGRTEIELLEIKTERLVQITSLYDMVYTTSNPAPVDSEHTMYWLSPTQLLIGMIIIDWQGPVKASPFVQTVIYNTASNTSTLVAESFLNSMSINSLNGKLALSLSAFYKTSPYFQPSGTVIKTGHFSAKTNNIAFDSNVSLPSGSDLFWSPDGKMLAYRQAEANNFIFVTDSDPPKISYVFPNATIDKIDGAKTLEFIPLGWVEANAVK